MNVRRYTATPVGVVTKALWATASGWEYDLLRCLPPETAAAIWQNASRGALPAVFLSPWTWLIFLAFLVTSVGIYAAVQMLGLGLAIGGFLEVIILHRLIEPLVRWSRPRIVKPFVRNELLAFARSELRRTSGRCTREDQPRRPQPF